LRHWLAILILCLFFQEKGNCQKIIWASQIHGQDACIKPLGLSVQDENRFFLVFKSDKAFSFGRKNIPVEDSSRFQVLSFHQNGESMETDTARLEFQKSIPNLAGNEWLLKTKVRNGNYYLAYGLSTPLRIPVELTWSLAYLDGMGHRLWEFHLPETVKVRQIKMLRDGKCLLVGAEKQNNGKHNILIWLWDEYGHEVWKKSQGGKSDDEALSACQDGEGNLFASGYFSADSSFMGNVADLSGKEVDGFIACYDEKGTEKFFYRQRGSGFNSVPFIEASSLGKVAFVASFSGKDWRLNPFGFPKKGKADLAIGLIDPLQTESKTQPLRIFPNPARELIYFGLEKPWAKGPILATLHQKDGTVLQSLKISGAPGSSFRFNVSNTKPGAYFLSLKASNKTLTERVLVE
jgi:hypothetical protein